jgi:protein TonB
MSISVTAAIAPHDASRKAIGFALVLVLHIAAIAGLAQSLGYRVVEVLRPPLEASLVAGAKQGITPERVKPLSTARLSAPPLPVVPLPEVRIEAAPRRAPAGAGGRGDEAAPSGRRQPVRTAAVVDLSRCAKYPYPPEAMKAKQSGTVLLSVVIEVDGSVVQSKIERSSGSLPLDEGARRAILYCRFRPATVDGVPERTRASVEYQWKIE